MIYKCPNCSGSLRYEITKHKMVCDYCGGEYSVPETENSVLRENDNHQTMETKIFSCSACGAQLMINNVETATFCAFCGQPTIVFNRIANVRKPDLILPFKVTKEEACNSIQQRLCKGFFIPSKYKKIKPELIRGIYIPFAMGEGKYEEYTLLEGEIGGTILNVKKNYYRHMVTHYLGLPVDMSVKFDDELAERLAPYPYEDMKPFDPAYLSGFYADAGDESRDNLMAKVREKSEKYHTRKIIGIKKTIIESKGYHGIKNVKQAMIPMWFFISHSGKYKCTILVNGYTGKVVGAVPVVKIKVAILAILVGVPLFVLFAYLGSIVAPFFSDMGSIKRELLTVILGLFLGLPYGWAIIAYKNYRKGVDLTKQKDVFDFAKNRQDE